MEMKNSSLGHSFDLLVGEGAELVERSEIFTESLASEKENFDCAGTFGCAGSFGGTLGSVGTFGCCC